MNKTPLRGSLEVLEKKQLVMDWHAVDRTLCLWNRLLRWGSAKRILLHRPRCHPLRPRGGD